MPLKTYMLTDVRTEAGDFRNICFEAIDAVLKSINYRTQQFDLGLAEGIDSFLWKLGYMNPGLTKMSMQYSDFR